jgi:hypothetical protein
MSKIFANASSLMKEKSVAEMDINVWFFFTIKEGIKWSLSMNIITLTQYYDSVIITGKYQYDESWTEAFATFKNAEQWKKNVTDNIHSTASKNYKVKIDIGGTRRLPAKGDATIIITITWNPPATA